MSTASESTPTIKLALVGAGMFGGDVHLRAYAEKECPLGILMAAVLKYLLLAAHNHSEVQIGDR